MDTRTLFPEDDTTRCSTNNRAHAQAQSTSPVTTGAAAGLSDSSVTEGRFRPSGESQPPPRQSPPTAAAVSQPVAASLSSQPPAAAAPGSHQPMHPTPRHSIDAILGLPGRAHQTLPSTTVQNHLHSPMLGPDFQARKEVACKANRLTDQEFARDRDAERERDQDLYDGSGEYQHQEEKIFPVFSVCNVFSCHNMKLHLLQRLPTRHSGLHLLVPESLLKTRPKTRLSSFALCVCVCVCVNLSLHPCSWKAGTLISGCMSES